VSRAISSKECFIRHISKILHQASLIFSTPWSNACKLERVGHSKSDKRMYTKFWTPSGRMN
jgi:hypothetical protein